MLAIALLALASYIIGSIPSGYLAGRIAGLDIRKTGSGNIGATNVTRLLGKRYGYPVFLADFSKGVGAVLLARWASRHFHILPESPDLPAVIAGVSCVMGNAFPFWLRFRGGKGVATSAGMLFGLMPLAALVVIIIWIVTFLTTRYVSVASILAALALPLTVIAIMHFTGIGSRLILYVCSGLAGVVILRHRSNIARLMRGTEQRFRRSED